MDVVYIGAIVAFLAVVCAFAAGCDQLGRRE
ncbi:MAG TPA: potassium ABC transporter ATPase [Noviherbaspirillum sp.]|nr:potassium ABC transporter ATPase [Noviherbaspirillum sp.]